MNKRYAASTDTIKLIVSYFKLEICIYILQLTMRPVLVRGEIYICIFPLNFKFLSQPWRGLDA